MKVVIFGLGVHGGGIGAAKYFARRGDDVLVTDLRTPEELSVPLLELQPYHCRYRLGGHQEKDFIEADLVVKNPAVSPDHTLLGISRSVCSDFSYALPRITSPVIAVTGTKGKSTAVAAAAYLLKQFGYVPEVIGNCGISPFSLLETEAGQIDSLSGKRVVIAEISSWQLGDLARYDLSGRKYFFTAVVTSLYRDHLNTYRSYQDYIGDKRIALEKLLPNGKAVLPNGSLADLLRDLSIAPKRLITFDGNTVSSIASKDRNCLAGRIAPHLQPVIGLISSLGLPVCRAADLLEGFGGIRHRQEIVCRKQAVTVINDSAATIPEAVLYAMDSLPGRIHLITGGTDKKLDPATLAEACRRAVSVTLLAGSLTEKLVPLLREQALPFSGPYGTMEEACSTAWSRAAKDSVPGSVTRYLLLSPGSASFDLFSDEFDRGDQFCRFFDSSA